LQQQFANRNVHVLATSGADNLTIEYRLDGAGTQAGFDEVEQFLNLDL